MHSFVHIHLIKKVSNMRPCVPDVLILMQVDFFLLERSHQPLTIGVLCRSATRCHTDLNMCLLQQGDIARRRVLDALFQSDGFRGNASARPVATPFLAKFPSYVGLTPSHEYFG